MRFTSILRLASAALLLCSMSSFAGCEKTDVGPRSGKNCHKTIPPADSTKTGGTR